MRSAFSGFKGSQVSLSIANHKVHRTAAMYSIHCRSNLTLLSTQVKIPGQKNGEPKSKDPALELTPLEKMLQNAGPITTDSHDKFFGLENVSASMVFLNH